MKIEKINENQIRCELNRGDLEERQIKLAELAYGSEKAKKLFHEMVKEATERYGFEVNDSPLMVEAIPASSESLVLLISKVDCPDELDPRFSRFSDPGEEYFDEEGTEEEMVSAKGADDILDLFEGDEKADDKDSSASGKEERKADSDLIRVFEFSSLEKVTGLARALKDYYQGSNSLFKDTQRKLYFLLMHKNTHTPKEFNKFCNMTAEFGEEVEFVPSMSAYFEEHAEVIIAKKALQTLAML